MDQLAGLVDVLTIVALASGLLFAAFEWRGSRRERRRQSQILLLRSFESPEFLKAMRRLLFLPDGLSRQQVEETLGEDGSDLLWYWLGTMESIGILVFNREIDIRLVDQSFGGPVIVIWRKLRGYVEAVRGEVGRDTMHEWYQWLVERAETLEREEGRTAAHLLNADWRP
jgi:hypothetical protein